MIGACSYELPWGMLSAQLVGCPVVFPPGVLGPHSSPPVQSRKMAAAMAAAMTVTEAMPAYDSSPALRYQQCYDVAVQRE